MSSLRMLASKPLHLASIGCVLIAIGCARQIGGDPPAAPDAGDDQDRDAGMDGGRFGNAPSRPPVDSGMRDDYLLDGAINPDAFFINDPPPPYCGPGDGGAPPPTGTPECPGDKNREGCRCPTIGDEAACWPGKRINREQGICRDGVTRCIDTTEFGPVWGPCEGYVLPVEGAAAGPEACRCFSNGTWRLSNLSPCIYRGADTWLYSSKLAAGGTLDCGTEVREPPVVPSGTWSTSTLNVDCAGEFTLCYTIKAGNVTDPRPDDCVITEHCEDVTYIEAGEDQDLPDLPAWSSHDSECAAQFDQRGGYGEMSVLGESVQCDAIDDGSGARYVFHRTNYCPPSCQQTPEAPGCVECRAGGSGEF